MVAGTDLSPMLTVLEGRHSKGNASAMEDEILDALNSSKQRKIRKPPWHLMRHCMSSVRLAPSTELELDIDTKSLSEEKSGFLPVFHSGSCSEKGPKQYMEDEHICLYNLPKHLGETADFPSPGAFYGVTRPLLQFNHFSCSTLIFCQKLSVLLRMHFACFPPQKLLKGIELQLL